VLVYLLVRGGLKNHLVRFKTGETLNEELVLVADLDFRFAGEDAFLAFRIHERMYDNREVALLLLFNCRLMPAFRLEKRLLCSGALFSDCLLNGLSTLVIMLTTL